MGTHPIFESDFDCLTVAERMPRFQKGIGLGMKKERKKGMPEEFQENAWDCTVCTYKNPIHTYKCQICDAPRGSSTRKSRITEQIIQKQQQTQLMAQYGEGSSSILEEVRRQSLADAGKNGLVDEEDEDDPFPAITKLENLGGPKTAVLFTPGGTFSLTPLQTGTVFNFPTLAEVKTVDDNTQFSKTL